MDLAPPPADAAPPAPPTAAAPDRPGRIVAGVAALLADRLDMDAVWLRIGFVLLALVGGVGIIVYGALWLVFVVGAHPARRWARWAGGAVLVLGLPFALTRGLGFADGPVAVIALLAGLTAALWQPRRPLRSVTSFLAPVDPPAPDLEGSGARPGASGVDDGSPARFRRPAFPRPARRPASILGRLTLGVAVVVGAAGALIDQANGGRLHPEQWIGAAAVVCGCGLLVGTVAGRARWLIVPAAVFAATGFASGEAARVGVEPTALGVDQHVSVGARSSGDRREHVVVGSISVSIDGVPSEPLTVDARSGIGAVRIWAAADITVEVRPDARHGHVAVDGGRRPDEPFTIGPEGPPDVVVVARVGRGDIDVWESRVDAEVATSPTSITAEEGEYVSDGVLLVPGGRFLLGDGDAVIFDDDTVLARQSTRDAGGNTVIVTSYGEFRLLPGGHLVTPGGEELDLPTLRQQTSSTATTLNAPDGPSGGTVPPTFDAVGPFGTVTPTRPGG